MTRRRRADAWDEAVGRRKATRKYGFGTLGWVLGQYRQSPQYRSLSPSTRRTYEQAFDRLHAFGQQDIRGLRRRHVLQIRDSLADTAGIANTVVSAIRQLCRWALDHEIIDVDPTARVSRLELGEWRRWTDDEMRRFYHETYEALRRVMVLALYTGQRRGDLCRMVWSDVEGGAIRVTQQKTDARLWIPIHPTLQQHLSEWRRETETVTVLAHSDRRPWQPDTLSRAFSNEITRLGMKGCTIHGFRKTAAAKLAEAGCTTKQIMAITGHASLTEVERYTREAEQRGLAEGAMSMVAPLPWEMVHKPLKRKA